MHKLNVLLSVPGRHSRSEDGYVGVELDTHQSIDDRCGDELMPVDAPVHQKATRDDGVISFAPCQPHGVERNFEGTWYTMYFKAVWWTTSPLKLELNRVSAGGNDVLLPACRYNGHLARSCYPISYRWDW